MGKVLPLLIPSPSEGDFPAIKLRPLRGIAIPQGIDKVIVEAHDSVHEYGGRTMTVEVT